MSKDPFNVSTAIKDGDEAKQFFDPMIDVRKRVGAVIKSYLYSDTGRRYYCGRDGSHPEKEDLFFFFNKESIDNLLKLLTTGKDGKVADGLVVVPGIRAYDGERPEDAIPEHDGRPTVMLFPYNYYKQNESPDNVEEYILMLGEGREHPGTGTFPKNDPKDPDITKPIPVGSIHIMSLLNILDKEASSDNND